MTLQLLMLDETKNLKSNMFEYLTSFMRMLDPLHKASPLSVVDLGAMGDTWVKDERNRLGLGSFKAIGGIYAVASMLKQHFQKMTGKPWTFEMLFTPEGRELASSVVFVCASAGNHGLAVARGAQIFGACAKVFLPLSAPRSFIERLTALDAKVMSGGDVYDEAIQKAEAYAYSKDAIYLSDYAASSDEVGPSLVMEGYALIGYELFEHFSRTKHWPTHVFLQAGVGGFAAAVTKNIRETWTNQPKIIIVEPEKANCLEQSVLAGAILTVTGGPSNMHRLDCKKPSVMAFQILANAGVFFETVTDEQANEAVGLLNGSKISTTPSGAAGYAGATNFSRDLLKPFKPLVLITEDRLNT